MKPKTKKNVVLYFGGDSHKVRIQASFRGLQKRGYKIVHYIREDQALFNCCAFGFSSGYRKPTKKFGDFLLKKYNIKTLTADLGYLKRAKGSRDLQGYNQIGLNQVGWVTPISKPSDRFEALQIPLETSNYVNNKTILVCGQVPGDGQHNLGVKELEAYFSAEIDKLRDKYPDKFRYVFRPHPLFTNMTLRTKIDGFQLSTIIPSHQAFSEAHAVLTYNSTIGVEALAKGIPVICHKDAHFAPLANTTSDLQEELYFPSLEQRQDYFNRLAYSQWTIKELEEGLFLDHMLELL